MTGRTLIDVLAGSDTVTTAARDFTPMTSGYYDPGSIWAVVAYIDVTNEDLKLYPGNDPHGNQIAYLSNRPPKTKARAGAPPAKSATVFRQGSITFNNLPQVVAEDELEEKHFVAGAIMAANAGFAELSSTERETLTDRLAELEGVVPEAE